MIDVPSYPASYDGLVALTSDVSRARRDLTWSTPKSERERGEHMLVLAQTCARQERHIGLLEERLGALEKAMHRLLKDYRQRMPALEARVAELEDARVSNTRPSGGAGSIPAPGTTRQRDAIPCVCCARPNTTADIFCGACAGGG